MVDVDYLKYTFKNIIKFIKGLINTYEPFYIIKNILDLILF